jgi:hypothetical protein
MEDIVQAFKEAVIEIANVDPAEYEVEIDNYITCDDQPGTHHINLTIEYHLIPKNQTSRYTIDDLKEEFGKRLDELVHDMFSERASEVNNGGICSQVEFLIEDGFMDVVEIGNYLRGKLA